MAKNKLRNMAQSDNTTSTDKKDVRRINVTFTIPDNDLIEYNFERRLREVTGGALTDYRVLKDTSYLYETDENFRKLCKSVKEAKKKYNDYINKTKIN